MFSLEQLQQMYIDGLINEEAFDAGILAHQELVEARSRDVQMLINQQRADHEFASWAHFQDAAFGSNVAQQAAELDRRVIESSIQGRIRSFR